MEIQNKLDEDFLFYLRFVEKGLNKFKDTPREYNLSKAWLDKLVEPANTVEEKRKRNVYLSQLVLCMEEGELKTPFTTKPSTVLPKPSEYFVPTLPDIKEPAWVNEVLIENGDTDKDNIARTYIATKALAGGKGAMAYIALSLDDQQFEYKGEGFDAHMERKFAEIVPPLSEMERILINRKVPEERQKVVNFYNYIVQDIAKEIDGRIPRFSNPQINNMIKQLINNLQQKGQFEKYEEMSCDKQREELLLLLYARVQERIVYIKKREDFLDHVEMQEMAASFFETSLLPEDIHKEDKMSRPSKMWTQAINAGPPQKLVRELTGKYPPFIIKRFLELLASAKEKIAIKVQRRHESVFSQLKKELRKEGEKGMRKYEKTKASHDEIVDIKNAVLAAENRCFESHQRRQQMLLGQRKQRDELYNQMRETMLDTQHHVEEEAAYGKYLTKQINSLSARAEILHQVNEDSLQKLEDENITVMKNIQRLNKNVKQHEQRIANMKTTLARSVLDSGSQFFFV